jgi:tetraacyldisaccharide 4'-kinase
MSMIIRPLLYPLWLIYGTIVFVRNKLYDFKVLQSSEFHLPIISVGNLTVGGTGKTPHTEYLIRLLKKDYKIAFLSRGYKRKTKDFILATDLSTADSIGDEPMQIKRKFSDILVAVDRKRVNGIKKILENVPDIDIVLLDDAYQHRSVDPGINILLVDYNRPLKDDALLPIGRLREPSYEKKRADIIIVSKVPRNISPMNKRLLVHNMDAQPHQKVYFSTIKYGELKPVVGSEAIESPVLSKINNIVLVTGVADPSSLLNFLSSARKEVIHFQFPDHYFFTRNDIVTIANKYNTLPEGDRIILTTEKDAVRLSKESLDLPGNTPEAWYYLPIEIEFLPSEGDTFDHHIIHYVKNNSRNSILYRK